MEEDPDDPGVMWSHLEWFEPTETRRTWLTRTDLNKTLTLEIEYECETCEPDEIARGNEVTLTVRGAAPGNLVRWYCSHAGCDSTCILALGVTLEVAETVYLLGSHTADEAGTVVKYFTVPATFPLADVWVQAAELEIISANFRRIMVESWPDAGGRRCLCPQAGCVVQTGRGATGARDVLGVTERLLLRKQGPTFTSMRQLALLRPGASEARSIGGAT